MNAAYSLSFLRDGIFQIISSMRTENKDGDISIDEAIKRIHARLGGDLEALQKPLIDITLRKLIHDVAGRKRLRPSIQGQSDLFGKYHGVPAMVTTEKGKKRDVTKLTQSDVEKWLERRAREDTEAKQTDENFRRMFEDLKPYLQSPEDTLEDAARRKFGAEAPQKSMI